MKSGTLSDLEELILRLSIAQPVSFYEVLHCDPGHGMRLRDLFIGGEVEVEEHKGSEHVQMGDILYGHVSFARCRHSEPHGSHHDSAWQKGGCGGLASAVAAQDRETGA